MFTWDLISRWCKIPTNTPKAPSASKREKLAKAADSQEHERITTEAAALDLGFILSSRFLGHVHGYAYKSADGKLGYHSDTPPTAADSPSDGSSTRTAPVSILIADILDGHGATTATPRAAASNESGLDGETE